MTSIAPARAPAPSPWLHRLAVRSRGAEAWLLTDSVAAIGFAAGVAGAVSHADNLAATAPWLASTSWLI